MGYSGLVKRQARKAFSLAKDLAVDITLTKKSSTGFNFGTLEAGMGVAQTLIVKGIIVDKTKRSSESKVMKTQVIMLSEDVSSFSDFDTLSINGLTYLPERPLKDDGYTLTVTLVKEV